MKGNFLYIITIILSFFLLACNSEIQEAVIPPETAVDSLSEPDARLAEAKIRELNKKIILPEAIREDEYNRYLDLSSQSIEVLNRGDAVEICSFAEELSLAYENLKYKQGDTPRIYISTKATSNYSIGAAITASSGSDSIGNAIDGETSSAWTSDENPHQEITLNLGNIRSLGFISVEWGKCAAKTCKVSTSSDGIEWTEICEDNTGGRFKKQRIILPQVIETKHIRLAFSDSVEVPYVIEDIIVSDREYPESDNISQTEYSDAQVVIVDREGGKYKPICESIQIKVRGNSTANSVKKPYNIKFTNKMKIFGIKGTRKWSLLANVYDKTMLRNKLSAELSNLAGVTPYLESTFVDLYLNGEYKGTYQLTLPVTDGTVDIDVEKGEMLFERNGNYNLDAAGKNYNYTPLKGIRFVPIDPEKGTETEEQKAFIKDLLRNVEYACSSGIKQNVERIIDIDSFVGMYICEELLKDIDIFYGSTYFYYKDGLFYSGPIWDMDISMGNVSASYSSAEEKYAKYHNLKFGGHQVGNGTPGDSTTGNWATVDFYEFLCEHDWFMDLVREKYTELIPEIENIYSEGGRIDQLIEEFGASFKRNYEECGYVINRRYSSFENDHPLMTYGENVEYLKDWLQKRDEWMRAYLGID